MADPRVRPLTIFLIKEGLAKDQIIKKLSTHRHRFFRIGDQRYDVYAKRLEPDLPDWWSFFEDRLPDDIVGTSDLPGVVLLLDVDDRTFALTFGQGRHLLWPDSYEDQFGLRVVLNSVDSVRSVEKRTFNAIHGKTKTQASSNTDVGHFEFDIERDLLRGVSGRPESEPCLGQQLSGVYALSAFVEVDLAGLPELLRRYRAQYEKPEYKSGFEFVDHMRAINGGSLKDTLDGHLIDRLNIRIQQLLKHRVRHFPFELIIPEVVDFSTSSGWGYSSNVARHPPLADINIDTFLSFKMSKCTALTLEDLKRSAVYGFNNAGDVVYSWAAYRCITGEIDFKGSRYVLSEGNWYEINKDYAKELDVYINKIPRFELKLPLYRGGEEKDYNNEVATVLPGFFNFDRKLIHPVSKQSIEYCDLYTETLGYRDLIHVKHGTSSAVLSHLFAQGTTSAEVCSDFDACREEAEKMIAAALGPTASADPRRPTESRTIYGIIRSRAGSLPFFSKVNLRRACRDMNRSKMRFALAEIEYDSALLVRKVKTKKKK